MSYRTKIMLSFGFVSLLTVLLMFVIFDKINHDSRTRDIFHETEDSIQLLATMIDSEFDRMIDYTEIISDNTDLLEALEVSNEYYGTFTEQARTDVLSSKNDLWLDSSLNDSFVLDILSNDVSTYLKTIVNRDSDIYGEIFVTNKYGAVVGATSKLTTYTHEGKYWWDAAYEAEDNGVFIDDRGYDYSVGDTVVGVVIPIYDSGEFTGVLKVNYLLSGILNEHITHLNHVTQEGEYMIIRPSGEIIARDGYTPIEGSLDQIYMDLIISNELTVNMKDLGNDEVIYGYAPLTITHSELTLEFGGNSLSIDQVGGNETGGWIVMYIVYENVAFHSIHEANSIFAQVSILAVFILSVLIFYVTSYFSKPLKLLSENFERVGTGNYDVHLNRSSNDEFGNLFKVFNRMASNLARTTTSKEILEQEMERRVLLEERLIKLSRIDELTQIYNRRAFNEYFEKYIHKADRDGLSIGILLLDIDDFKNVNDTLGHNIGDEVLKLLASSVNSTLRKSDVFARWGGEEFIIMIPDANPINLKDTAERVRKVINLNVHKEAGAITVSVGMTLSSKLDEKNLVKIVHRADEALYEAKTSGKNKSVLKK